MSVFARSTRVELPFPPSLNHYYRHVATRTLISQEGRRYRKTVCALLTAAGVEPIEGSLVADITVCPPDRRRRDIDNLLKCLLDALQHGGAYADDGRIDELTIRRGRVVPGGSATVVLTAKE